PKPRRPPSCHEVNTCLGLFLYTCKHVTGLFRLSLLESPPTLFFSKMELLRGDSAGRLQVPIYLLRRVLTI
ncbi:hypothetical protein K443DRAFT_71333, partial [Laccaria amethystina LaAM-08-1]